MIKKVEYTTYALSTDITFIMVDTFIDNLFYSTECVGWYYGEEDEKLNYHFTGKLKATFKWED